MIRGKSNSNTPYVKLDIERGNLTIIGRSYPEHPELFYDPILLEITKYKEQLKISKMTLRIALEIMNSGSTKYIFRLVKDLYELSMEMEIIWYYEEDDESMFEEGNIYKEFFPDSKFKLIEVEDLRKI
jgi:hypothetical protein